MQNKQMEIVEKYIIIINHENNTGGQIVYSDREEAKAAYEYFEDFFKNTNTKLKKKIIKEKK